ASPLHLARSQKRPHRPPCASLGSQKKAPEAKHDHGQLCGTTEKDRGQLMREIASPSCFTDDASALDRLTPRPDNSSDNDLQRAEGSCRIVLGSSERGTRVMDVYQKSPIRVLFPRTSGSRV